MSAPRGIAADVKGPAPTPRPLRGRLEERSYPDSLFILAPGLTDSDSV